MNYLTKIDNNEALTKKLSSESVLGKSNC